MAFSGPSTIPALKSFVQQGLEALINEPRDFKLFRSMLADTVHIQHDSNEPITDPDVFMDSFQNILQYMPDFHTDFIDMVAEVDESGHGGRVWVYSKITGKKGTHQIVSVDMVTVDKEGKITATKDVQRSLAAK